MYIYIYIYGGFFWEGEGGLDLPRKSNKDRSGSPDVTTRVRYKREMEKRKRNQLSI